MRKLRITALSALLLMAGLAAQAQSTKQETVKTSAGKEVTYTYTELKPGEVGNVTVTLSEETVMALSKGEEVEIGLETPNGLMYELKPIELSSGLQYPDPNLITTSLRRLINLSGSGTVRFVIRTFPVDGNARNGKTTFVIRRSI